MLQPLRSSILSSSAPLLRPLASTSISKRICSTIRLSARTMCNDASASIPTPPVAKKVKHEMELFGDVRVDNYYWLRDDHRSDPEVLSYLKEENDYTDRVMSGTKQLEDEIYAEIRARIKEDDISAPIRRGPYYYYRRTLQGKEYVQHCRRLAPNHEASLSVHDTMPTGPDAPPEHVILDENVKAQGEEFYSISAFKVSPNGKLVAYAEDTIGNEIYTVHIIDIESRAPVGEPLVRMTSELEWAGDEALVYVTMDEILRLDKVQVLALDQYAMKFGIGSYFKASRLVLVGPEGFHLCIAHIRGCCEWETMVENGKLLKKNKYFHRFFIACAEHLIDQEILQQEKLCIMVEVLGGLLIYLRQLFAEVPFVDIKLQMLDPTIPLTTSESGRNGVILVKKNIISHEVIFLLLNNCQATMLPAFFLQKFGFIGKVDSYPENS
nr:Dipeptidyl aminopeptidase BI [Ipomoea batatas]